jgi:lysozyme
MKATSSLLTFFLILCCAQNSFAVSIPHSKVVCAGAAENLQGVDVSGRQSRTDWTALASGGSGFAFVKATQGSATPNPSFASEWTSAGKNGLIRSAYHYFIATDDPIAQANYFLETIGTPDETDLPPMLDLEPPVTPYDLSQAEVVARTQQWLDYVEAGTGRIPIVYTDPAYFNQLGNPAGFDRYPLYISDYEVKCPKVPEPWVNWVFWQYSAQGKEAGIPGMTDLDMFNGLFDNLISFLSTTVSPAAQAGN